MKTYSNEVITLATEVAEKLNDIQSINAYLTICDRYKEERIRKVLDKVLSIPISQIRKTPGALFTYLIQQQYESRYYNRD